ncbi:MAG: cyclopropane fatty acyl phospholipid synthase [Patescibacteria group bacterium]|mgnify:CR=1 FL=1
MKSAIEALLTGTGVTFNGPNPSDIRVLDDRLYARVLAQGSLGFGEAYMDGWWECDAIDEMIAKLLRANVASNLRPSISLLASTMKARLWNMQNKQGALKVGRAHYDIGNDLYRAMLGKRLTYTCGYWKTAQTLDKAQEAKLDLVCKKIGLQPGQHVLDIGCGWGSFAKFAAEKYGARVTGITISKEQLALGKELCAGLPVELRFQDYRDVTGQFDHIVSLGMFEHVGYKNYATYFAHVKRLLKPGGLFLLHTIGGIRSVLRTDPWIEKYIFPNSILPSVQQITAAAERQQFVMEDWHNFSADYDKTLMAWYANVEAHWNDLKGQYNGRFHRMWTYYLLSCAGSFRARQNQLWQIVFSPTGVQGGYTSVR